jgi:lipopolysaccharide/colanic/teichoic acid biosynthesis glycosyltransferase
LLDIVLAAAGLVFLAPLMLLVGLAIAVEGGRPIFFSQVRLGRGGRHFHMHKFRKFHDRGRPGGGSLTMEDDPRLTRVGGFLAPTKLDELPQLWNVLKGEMAIVGPRPESLDFRDCFDGPYRSVLEHKPGIFGPSQVLFRHEGCLYRGRPDPEQFYRDVVFPLKAQIDLAYFPHRTLSRDIAWAARGALSVFGCSSAFRQATLPVQQREGLVGEEGASDRGLRVELGLFARVARRGIIGIGWERGAKAASAGSAAHLPALPGTGGHTLDPGAGAEWRDGSVRLIGANAGMNRSSSLEAPHSQFIAPR